MDAVNENPFFVTQYMSGYCNSVYTHNQPNTGFSSFHGQHLKFQYKPSHAFNPNVNGSSSQAYCESIADVSRRLPAYATEHVHSEARIDAIPRDVFAPAMQADQPVHHRNEFLPPAGQGAPLSNRRLEPCSLPAHAVDMSRYMDGPHNCKQSLSVREPIRRGVPGYQGYIVQEPFTFGKTYGDSTAACLKKAKDDEYYYQENRPKLSLPQDNPRYFVQQEMDEEAGIDRGVLSNMLAEGQVRGVRIGNTGVRSAVPSNSSDSSRRLEQQGELLMQQQGGEDVEYAM